MAHRWYIRKGQDREYLVKKVCIKEFVDKEFIDKEFVDKKFVVKEFVVKEFIVKEFVDKEFVNKDLLMSLWGMRMAHKKEARGIVLGDQRRLDGSGTGCG